MAGRLGPAHPVSWGHLLGEVRVAARFPGEVTWGRDAESGAIKTVGAPGGVKRADCECKGGADGRGLVGGGVGRLGGGQTGTAELRKHGREAVVRKWDVGFCGVLEVELLWMQIEARV